MASEACTTGKTEAHAPTSVQNDWIWKPDPHAVFVQFKFERDGTIRKGQAGVCKPESPPYYTFEASNYEQRLQIISVAAMVRTRENISDFRRRVAKILGIPIDQLPEPDSKRKKAAH